MDHIMLDYRLRIIVLRTIENQISGLHFMELKIYRASVNLITLIAGAKLEPKVFLEILNDAADEPTAIEEKWRFVKRIILLSMSLCIGHAQILLTLSDKLLP